MSAAVPTVPTAPAAVAVAHARVLPGLSGTVQLTVLAVIVVVGLVAGGFVGLMWRRGRTLRASSETLRQYWRGVEKVLVDHHQAAEDLVRLADATGGIRRREREHIEAAVAAATLTGSPAERARREIVLRQAVRELIDALEGRPVARTHEVIEAVRTCEDTWEHVRALGSRYSALVAGHNRLVTYPVLRWWNRRLGWRTAEAFVVERADAVAAPVPGRAGAGDGSA